MRVLFNPVEINELHSELIKRNYVEIVQLYTRELHELATLVSHFRTIKSADDPTQRERTAHKLFAELAGITQKNARLFAQQQNCHCMLPAATRTDENEAFKKIHS